jgi:hypothetical protein
MNIGKNVEDGNNKYGEMEGKMQRFGRCVQTVQSTGVSFSGICL